MSFGHKLHKRPNDSGTLSPSPSRLLVVIFKDHQMVLEKLHIHLWFPWILFFILISILEKEMANHSSILAWRILWTREPGGLLTMGLHRVEHDWSDLARMHACIGERSGNPLQYSCLENLRDRGAWWAAVYGVPQSWTRLMQLSSSSSISILHPNYLSLCFKWVSWKWISENEYPSWLSWKTQYMNLYFV